MSLVITENVTGGKKIIESELPPIPVAGEAYELVQVNVTEDALEYTDAPQNIDSINFNTAATPSGGEGQIHWNAADYTLNIDTGLGPELQVGQEMYIIVYNDTGGPLANGTVVHPVGGATDGRPHVNKANATTHVGITRAIWVLTMEIADGAEGIATQLGNVRGLNTDSFSVGDNLYVSTTDGLFTNVKPEFPDYAIQIGGVAVSDPLDGVIVVSVKGEIADTTNNAWNGVFRESFDFRVSSNGTVITGSLEPSNGHDDMTMMFSDGFAMLATTPAATIALTAGTDTNPQTNYVYIPSATKVLTVSTSDWPTTEHIKVAQLFLSSAATVQENGSLRNQNWNDHIADTNTYQGHLSHIAQAIRQKIPATWKTGTEASVDINTTPTPDAVYVKTTGGKVMQVHDQVFPLFDMTQYTIDAVSIGSSTFTISDDGDLSSTFPDERVIKVNGSTGNDGLFTIVSTAYSAPDFVITVSETISDATVDGTIGDDIHVVNNFATAYVTTTDLASQTLDATGASLSNRSFSFVIWGAANKTGEESHLMLNLPTGSYARLAADSAVEDADNYSVYDIPVAFHGVGFLIARATFQLSATGNDWTLYDLEDLRGKIPNTVAGGGGGGGTGATTYLGLADTDSTYAGSTLKIVRVNAAETALEFLDASGEYVLLTTDQNVAGVKTFTDGFHINASGELGVDISTSTANKVYINMDTDGSTGRVLNRADNGDVSVGDIADNDGDLGLWAGGQRHMTVTPNDTVGIQVASPESVLHLADGTDVIVSGVSDPQNYALQLQMVGSTTGEGNGIVFTTGGTTIGSRLAQASIIAIDRGADNAGSLDFYVDGGASYWRALRLDYDKKAYFDGAIDIADEATFNSSINIHSTDAGAIAAPLMNFYRDSASPASLDEIGALDFYGKNSIGSEIKYCRIYTEIRNHNYTAEASMIAFNAYIAGSEQELCRFGHDGTLFNSFNKDIDFEIRKNTTGAAYIYNAGSDTHLFSGTPTFNKDNIHFRIVSDSGAAELHLDSETAIGRVLLRQADGDVYVGDLDSNGGSFFIRSDAGDRLAIDAGGNVTFNVDRVDADFTIRKKTSGDAYKYNAGLDEHIFSGDITFDNDVFIDESLEVDSDTILQGNLTTNGGRTRYYTEITSNTTLTAVHDIIYCSGTFTVTLPAISSHPRRCYTIKNIGTGEITIATSTSAGNDDPDGIEGIEFVSTYYLSMKGTSIDIQGHLADYMWYIL